MNVSEYAACDATELSRLLLAGEISPKEGPEAALRAIEQVNPKLNAVVHGPFEGAGVAEGPFSGVPFAVKDTLWELGRPCEFGSRLLDGHCREARRNACGAVPRVGACQPRADRYAGVRVQPGYLAGRERFDAEPVGARSQPGRLEWRLSGARGGEGRADGSWQRRRRFDPTARRVVWARRAEALARPGPDRPLDRRGARRARARLCAHPYRPRCSPATGRRLRAGSRRSLLRGATPAAVCRGARLRSRKVACCHSHPVVLGSGHRA